METESKSYLHVALVLDASGSMAHLRETTIESLKSFFAGLKSEEDRTLLDVWQFNTDVRHLVDGADLNAGAPETLENYTALGGTALYDAVCMAVDALGAKFAAMKEEDRPDGVILAILTDGEENSSQEFTRDDVKNRIQHQSEKYNWQFKFLAANQDAVLKGREMGLARRACHTFKADSAEVAEMCCDSGALGGAVMSARHFARSMCAENKMKKMKPEDHE